MKITINFAAAFRHLFNIGAKPIPKPQPAPAATFHDVTVHVNEPSGAPVIGAAITVWWGDVPALTGQSDDFGRKTFSQIPDTANPAVKVQKDGYVTWQEGIGAEGDVSVAFVALRPARLAIVGPVTAQDRSMVDAAGPRLRLGVTWFWGPWAIDNDLARFDRNAKTLSDCGDYAPRMFGQVVNGGNYVNRQVTQAGLVRAMTRLRDNYTLRSLPVILGDCSDLNSDQKRQQVQQFIDLLRAYPSLLNAIIMAEGGNEGGHTGLQDIGLLGELYRMVQSAFPSLLVAPTSAEDYPWTDDSGGQISDVYLKTGASALSAHQSRGGSTQAIIRQMYGYNFLRVPPVGGPTEPWGIASSISSAKSFDELAAMAATTWVSGWALFTLHVGTGVYGLRESHDYGERYENFDEDPLFMAWAPKLETLRAALPQDLANFGNPHHADPKFNGTFPFVTTANESWDAENKAYGMRAYANVAPDGRFMIALLDQRRDFTITPARNMTATIRQMDWTKLTNTFDLEAGQPFTLKTPPSGYGIIEGRMS